MIIESKKQAALKTAYFSIVGNIVLALAKGIAGVFGNSYALVADAIESTTDVFSSLLVVVGLRYSYLPPDKNHPYGHGKAEAVVTFFVVVFLIVSAVVIAVQSIQNIQTPHEMPKPFTLIVLLAVVLIKEMVYKYVSKKSDQLNSTSLKADAWHHRSDAITSLLAFIGISIALFLGPGYEAADDWAALLASGFIIYNAYLIFRPALSEVMDEHKYDDLVEKIRVVSENVPGVKATEKCFIRKNGMVFLVDLHLVVNGDISVRKGHTLAHMVKDTLCSTIPEIADVHIHVEPDSL